MSEFYLSQKGKRVGSAEHAGVVHSAQIANADRLLVRDCSADALEQFELLLEALVRAAEALVGDDVEGHAVRLALQVLVDHRAQVEERVAAVVVAVAFAHFGPELRQNRVELVWRQILEVRLFLIFDRPS